MASRKAFRFIRWTLGGTAVGVGVGGSLAYLKVNNWDLSSSGLVRFGRAAVAVSHIVVDYKRSLSGITDPDEYDKIKSEVHLRSALRLRDMCCVNRGCFIKVGQHMGALEYLLPVEYVNTMKVLHSDAPQSTLEELHTVIREDLGQEVDEIFTSFEEKPLGAASLAQVHKATLKDGTEVAVKVQHPQVMAHAFIDMATMELLVRAVAWMFPEFQFSWLAEETKKNLPLELDFVNEAHNCERVARMFNKFSFLKVPKVYWDLTTPRVMTMEYCEGGQVNDREYMEHHGISVNEVARKLGELYSEMIFVQGYIHCDPHPGNVLVKKGKQETKIVLLDHGLYQTLTDDFRLNYSKLWISLIRADVNKIHKYSEKLGVGKLFGLFACMVTGRSWNAVSQGMDKKKFTAEEDMEIKTNASMYLPEISSILNQVPRQMLLIFKTNDLLRGIETTLKTRADAGSFITMSRCCVRAMFKMRRKHCTTYWCTFKLSIHERFVLFKITLYEVYLWLNVMLQSSQKALKM